MYSYYHLLISLSPAAAAAAAAAGAVQDPCHTYSGAAAVHHSI
jgi:hypothetical protein